jgi:hypothetical protein
MPRRPSLPARAVLLALFALTAGAAGPAFAEDLTVTGALTISTPTTYDNVTVTGTGVLTLSAPLTVNLDLTIQSGGLVTHALRDTAGLVLNVTGTLDVQSGGKIDVSAKGLRGGNNGSVFGVIGEALNASGSIVSGATTGGYNGAGASYGGSGGNCYQGGAVGSPNAVYGVLEAPRQLGSGGAGGSTSCAAGHGGGRVMIRAATLIVNGTLLANGGSGTSCSLAQSGGGSGGAIWLEVGALSGSGTISAVGGGAKQLYSDSYSGTGGGGRIAIYYDTMTFPTGNANLSARGGTTGNLGTAGTIYLKDDAQAHGDLIVDNGGTVPGSYTLLKTGLAAFRSLTLRNAGTLSLTAAEVSAVTVEQPVPLTGSSVLWLRSGVTLAVSNAAGFDFDVQSGSTLWLEASSVLEANSVRVNAAKLSSYIDLSFPVATDLELSGAGTLNVLGSSTLGLASLDGTNIQSGTLNLGTGSHLEVTANAATIPSGVTLVKDGMFGATDEIGDLTIQSGGLVTHALRDTAGLVLNVTGTLDVQSGGKIDVSARGLRGGANGSVFGDRGETFDAIGTIVAGAQAITYQGAGGGYGGLGGTSSSGSTSNGIYGLLETPRQLGSGGGGDGVGTSPAGHGGGRVTIAAGNCIVAGGIRADGGNGGVYSARAAGGGSGGSIWLTAGTLSGSGTISAMGGSGGAPSSYSYGGSGGGGRIAIYYCASNAFPLANISVAGGTTGSPGQPGTKHLAQTSYRIVASAGPHGSISPAETTSVACGADQGYTIAPDAGHHISDVLVDGVSIGAESTYTFTGVSAPHTIAASFAANQQTLAIGVVGSGSVTKDPDQPTYDYGSAVTLNAVAGSGFRFAGWSGDTTGTTDTLTVLLWGDTNVTATFDAVGDIVAALPSTACITPDHPCVSIPVFFDRDDTTPVRGYSVSLHLSPNLVPCATFTEGDYLSGVGGTYFDVLDEGGGAYTVDCAILGLPCGAVGDDTLFTLAVGSLEPGGAGTVTIDSVTVRDCENQPVIARRGPGTTITIDKVTPGAVALAAAQVRAGNDADGTTKIDLAWTGTVAMGDTVLIYRAPFGQYPEYDDLGGAPPALPAYPPPAPWEPAGWALAPQATLADEPGARDFWYYVAFVKDACASVSAVSNMTAGTLNYHLGDVMGNDVCFGDNEVGTGDISLLGGHYGVAEGNALYMACLDVGPTTNRSVNARPTTDNKINFEDMMMFAINYGTVSLTTAPVAAVAGDAVWMEGPAKVTAGQTFTASLRLSGSGSLLGLSADLGWDRTVAELVAVEPGELLTSQVGVVLHGGGGLVDCALLGADRRLAGEGELARVTFRALANGSPKLALGAVDARDAANRTVELTGTPPQVVPTVTSFAPAMPNPFRGTATLSYALAKAGAVELAIYGVDGRKVATLASGVQEAGGYRLVWDGGNARPGLYYARLTTPEGKFTRTVVLVK